MAFTTLTQPQKQFLETFLRGTQRTLSSQQALATYGITQLPARISEMRARGLQIRTAKNTAGNTTYRIVSRDVNGSRASIFN